MKSQSARFDCVVIGGGAAGMFAAITAAAGGQRVALLEPNERLGKKLGITGKGRCNVTNRCTPAEALQQIPRGGRFLMSALHRFTPEDTMEFFESRRCPLKTERGNRVFPVSDRSFDIVDVLRRELRQLRVQVLHTRALELLTADGRVCGVAAEAGRIAAAQVILCTGGCSYPATGSTGDGYRMAAALGHTIIAPRPSLVPLEEAGTTCARLQGLSLRNVALALQEESGKAVYRDFGELLFTHFGLSGPIVLSASSRVEPGKRYRAVLDLKPALDEEKLGRPAPAGDRGPAESEFFQPAGRSAAQQAGAHYGRALRDRPGAEGQQHHEGPAADAAAASQGISDCHPRPPAHCRGHYHGGRRQAFGGRSEDDGVKKSARPVFCRGGFGL